MFHFKRQARFSLLALGIFLAGSAQATLIPQLVSGPAPTGPGDFAYNYSIELSSQERLDPGAPAGKACTGQGVLVNCNPDGSFITLYDVGPSVLSTSVPTGWGSSVQLIGRTPSFIDGAFDSASLVNVTFFYTGSAAVHGNAHPGPYTGFQIVTSLDGTHMGTFSSQSTMDTGGAAGRLLQGVGSVAVPGGVDPPAGVPEPVTFFLMGAGLVALALLRHKHRRS